MTAVLDRDPLDAWARSEGASEDATLDVGYDLAWAGMFEAALSRLATVSGPEPLRSYAMGWIAEQAGDGDGAEAHRARARRVESATVFASRLEDVLSLEAAVAADPRDARAHALLGHWLYDRGRHTDAMAHWAAAARTRPAWAGVWRNLGIAAFNVERLPAKAARAFGRALAAAPDDARLLFEADQLARQRGVPAGRRLLRLEKRIALVTRRDDLSVEFAALLTQVGRADRALAFLEGRRFHPWEGGEGMALRTVRARAPQAGPLALFEGDATTATRPLRGRARPAGVAGRGPAPVAGRERRVPRARGCGNCPCGSSADARRWWRRAARGTGSARTEATDIAVGPHVRPGPRSPEPGPGRRGARARLVGVGRARAPARRDARAHRLLRDVAPGTAVVRRGPRRATARPRGVPARAGSGRARTACGRAPARAGVAGARSRRTARLPTCSRISRCRRTADDAVSARHPRLRRLLRPRADRQPRQEPRAPHQRRLLPRGPAAAVVADRRLHRRGQHLDGAVRRHGRPGRGRRRPRGQRLAADRSGRHRGRRVHVPAAVPPRGHLHDARVPRVPIQPGGAYGHVDS